MKKVILVLIGLSLTISASDYYYSYGKKVEVRKLFEQRSLKKDRVKYYKTDKGKRVGIKDEIIVQCEDGINCENILNKYDFTTISKLSDKLFLVKLNDSMNIFKMSQELYKNNDIKFAHPNFIKNRKRR